LAGAHQITVQLHPRILGFRLCLYLIRLLLFVCLLSKHQLRLRIVTVLEQAAVVEVILLHRFGVFAEAFDFGLCKRSVPTDRGSMDVWRLRGIILRTEPCKLHFLHRFGAVRAAAGSRLELIVLPFLRKLVIRLLSEQLSLVVLLEGFGVVHPLQRTDPMDLFKILSIFDFSFGSLLSIKH